MLLIKVDEKHFIPVDTNRTIGSFRDLLSRHVAFEVGKVKEKILNNHFVDHPEDWTGDPDRVPKKKKTIFNNQFRIDNQEFSLSQFYDFKTHTVNSVKVVGLREE